jgi:2-dehydro-3-deoxyphosphooctonate aldolase (KDO 8-P synthase)
MNTIKIGNIAVSNNNPMILIAGPCAMENRDMALRHAEHLKKLTDELKIPYIFKTSFDKANRSSLHAKRGMKLDDSLKVFQEINKTFGCLTVTDVHESYQCKPVAEVVDVLQIPAFLCRQTDLLTAAAETKKTIHIKKGQFLAPWDMKNACKKIIESGNSSIMLCERGTCFGYNRLISDMRSLKIMADLGYPVVFDATHSVQEPGGLGESSGGVREHVELLARAAVSVGVAGIYIETHSDPNNAYCDGPNMIPLHAMKDFLISIKKFDELAKNSRYTDMSC